MDQEIYNSEKYLKDLPLHGGFTVPDNYFTELESVLMVQEDLENIPSFINGFTVPDKYFSELNSNIISRLNPPEAKQFSIYVKPAFKWFGLAASIIFVYGIFLYQPRLVGSIGSNQKISAEDIAEHLNEEDLSEELLCDAGWCSEIEKLNMISDTSNMDALNKELEDAIILDEL